MSLKVNERFFVRDREYRVVMVNSSRAHCVPVEPERRSEERRGKECRSRWSPYH